MNGQLKSENGTVTINSEVIAQYAGSVAVGCSGIVGMTAVSVVDGLYKLLKPDYIRHGIKVDFTDNGIVLDFHVIIAYGVKITTVCDNLISTVKYDIEEFTGLKISKINVFVEGVRVID